MSSIKAIQSFTDAASKMTWGSPSIYAWRKACEDSLLRSRRRRVQQQERTPAWEYVVSFLVLSGLIVGGIFAFVWLLYLGFNGGL